MSLALVAMEMAAAQAVALQEAQAAAAKEAALQEAAAKAAVGMARVVGMAVLMVAAVGTWACQTAQLVGPVAAEATGRAATAAGMVGWLVALPVATGLEMEAEAMEAVAEAEAVKGKAVEAAEGGRGGVAATAGVMRPPADAARVGAWAASS